MDFIRFAIDTMNSFAEKYGWEQSDIQWGGITGNTRVYGKYERRHSSGGFVQSLRWSWWNDRVSVNKIASDGYWYDEPLEVALCEPDSLEKIEAFFA